MTASRACRFAAVIVALAMTGACSLLPTAEEMTVQNVAAGKIIDETLRNNIKVRTVAGAEGGNLIFATSVEKNELEKALASSLKKHGLSSEKDDSMYALDVRLLGLGEPAMGFDMTVHGYMNYSIINRMTKKPLIQRSVNTTYTATVGQAFVGATRVKIAKAGAIRENIREFIASLFAP